MDDDNSETAFLKEIGRALVISIGGKRQGKTWLLCKILKYCLDNNLFEEYHLILSQFENERDGKYDFLKKYPKIVFVYDEYHEVIAKKMLSIYEKKHIFFGIDDASGEFCTNMDYSLQKLCTRNEHACKCCIWLNVHSAKKVLSPLLRQQATNLFIYKMVNWKLLEDLYQEYFRMVIPDFKEFFALYKQVVFSQEHNALMYALDGHNEFNGIKTWKLLNDSNDEVKTNSEPEKKQNQEQTVQAPEGYAPNRNEKVKKRESTKDYFPFPFTIRRK